MTGGGPISGTPIDQEYTDIRVIHRPPSVFQWVTGAAMQLIGPAIVSCTAGGSPKASCSFRGSPKAGAWLAAGLSHSILLQPLNPGIQVKANGNEWGTAGKRP